MITRAPWTLDQVCEINAQQKKRVFPTLCPIHQVPLYACSSELYCLVPRCEQYVDEYRLPDPLWHGVLIWAIIFGGVVVSVALFGLIGGLAIGSVWTSIVVSMMLILRRKQ